MSQEIGVAWRIRVRKKGYADIEVVGMNPDRVEKIFAELEKKYLKA